jgi:hypothetical protein
MALSFHGWRTGATSPNGGDAPRFTCSLAPVAGDVVDREAATDTLFLMRSEICRIIHHGVGEGTMIIGCRGWTMSQTGPIRFASATARDTAALIGCQWPTSLVCDAGITLCKNPRFQPPPACHRDEGDRPLCRPDRHATPHQTAATSRASRRSGVSAHVYQWSLERPRWHVGLIARAAVAVPWLAGGDTNATDHPRASLVILEQGTPSPEITDSSQQSNTSALDPAQMMYRVIVIVR